MCGIHPNNYIDTADFRSFGKGGNILNCESVFWNVFQGARLFVKEMMMRRNIGIKIGAAGINHNFAQQPGRCELVQIVVDRCQ